jgi:hypothetical protein
MKRGAITVFAVMICFGCGSDRLRTVLVETDGADAAPSSTELDDIIRRDALEALKILDEALKGDDADLAGWAAVHILRLGVKHDADAVRATLARCVHMNDPMLAGLCWRWFATGNHGDVPRWKKRGQSEPIPAVMAAIALARGGKIPAPLADALGLPKKSAGGSKQAWQKEREVAVHALVTPYDNGPLALALTFVESRRVGWVDEDGQLTAARLRARLLDALAPGDEGVARTIVDSKPSANPPSTRLNDRLEIGLIVQPPKIIRKIVLEGSGSLRVEALRAMAITVDDPVAGDLGAAAAALHSEDPLTRVEAARTFLLLAARAVE